jgi:(p)ppGpp synthase/HD superfamily hydrolase
MKPLSNRFDEALVYASRLHKNQKRKGSGIPYLSHLLGVTALVIEDGGDEDAAIAALLHDAVEDQGGVKVLNEINSRFGERVANIVEGCTDAFTFPKPAWKTRKEQYLARLKNAGPEIIQVSLADKIHNASTTLRDLQKNGKVVWTRFNGGRESTLWYYQALVDVFEEKTTSILLRELKRLVKELSEF